MFKRPPNEKQKSPKINSLYFHPKIIQYLTLKYVDINDPATRTCTNKSRSEEMQAIISNLNVWKIVGPCELSWDQPSSSQLFSSLWLEALPFSKGFCGSDSPLAMHEQRQGRLPEPDQRGHLHEPWQTHRSCSRTPELPVELSHTEATMDYLGDIPLQK